MSGENTEVKNEPSFLEMSDEELMKQAPPSF